MVSCCLPSTDSVESERYTEVSSSVHDAQRCHQFYYGQERKKAERGRNISSFPLKNEYLSRIINIVFSCAFKELA